MLTAPNIRVRHRRKSRFQPRAAWLLRVAQSAAALAKLTALFPENQVDNQFSAQAPYLPSKVTHTRGRASSIRSAAPRAVSTRPLRSCAAPSLDGLLASVLVNPENVEKQLASVPGSEISKSAAPARNALEKNVPAPARIELKKHQSVTKTTGVELKKDQLNAARITAPTHVSSKQQMSVPAVAKQVPHSAPKPAATNVTVPTSHPAEPKKVLAPDQTVLESKTSGQDVKAKKVDLPQMLPSVVQPSVSKMPKVMVAASKGFASAAGKKHAFDPSKNEDMGKLDTFAVFDKAKSSVEPRWKVESALVFDGHGRFGRFMSHRSVAAMRDILTNQLGDVVLAPTLKTNDPRFNTISKQAVVAKLMNATDQKIRDTVDPSISSSSGTTATTVLAVSEAGNENSPVEIIASNLGDSAVLLLEMQTTKKCEPTVICAMSNEQNIREPRERAAVIAKMSECGYYLARAEPRRRALDVFLPRWFAQPRTIIHQGDVRYMAREVAKFQPSTPVYAIFGGKLRSYRVQFAGRKKERVFQSGLQLTGTIGDCDFEPFKRHTCDANSVKIVRLKKKPNTSCLLIAASDGLWDFVKALPAKNASFAQLVSRWWDQTAAHSPNPSLNLAQFLQKIATAAVSDDVTVAVMHYPGLGMSPQDLLELKGPLR